MVVAGADAATDRAGKAQPKSASKMTAPAHLWLFKPKSLPTSRTLSHPLLCGRVLVNPNPPLCQISRSVKKCPFSRYYNCHVKKNLNRMKKTLAFMNMDGVASATVQGLKSSPSSFDGETRRSFLWVTVERTRETFPRAIGVSKRNPPYQVPSHYFPFKDTRIPN